MKVDTLIEIRCYNEKDAAEDFFHKLEIPYKTHLVKNLTIFYLNKEDIIRALSKATELQIENNKLKKELENTNAELRSSISPGC